MEMKLEKLFFFMLEKEPHAGEKNKQVILYDEMDPAIEKIRDYMSSGIPAEKIELTKVSIKAEGIGSNELLDSSFVRFYYFG